MSNRLGTVDISYAKGAFCAWVGSSVDNEDGRSTELLESAPNFNQSVTWVAGECARKCSRFYLSLTIVRTDGTYCGSTAVAVEPRKTSAVPTELKLPLMAPTCGNLCRRAACGCVVTVSSMYYLTAVDKIPVDSSCPLVVAEQSYPYPTCTRTGWSALSQLARQMSKPGSFAEECRVAVGRRWPSYVYSACVLLGIDHHAPRIMTDREKRLLLVAALQRAAGCYTLEKIDDRGPTEICFGLDEDCDGQSVSEAMFANALLALPALTCLCCV